MDERFLEALTAEEAGDLRAAGGRRSYPAGVTLVHEGDDAGAVSLLLGGRIKAATIGGAGREAIVAVRGRGDLIGEPAAIDGGPRSGTVTCSSRAKRCSCPARPSRRCSSAARGSRW
jgi:CRP/FNR family cyclic AMP-dependent transcriptional regulator